MLILVFRVASS